MDPLSTQIVVLNPAGKPDCNWEVASPVRPFALPNPTPAEVPLVVVSQ
jgi:hypothetical protein